MKGQDWVALILALTVGAILIVITWAVLFNGYTITGEGVLGAVVGALILAVVRYLQRPA